MEWRENPQLMKKMTVFIVHKVRAILWDLRKVVDLSMEVNAFIHSAGVPNVRTEAYLIEEGVRELQGGLYEF